MLAGPSGGVQLARATVGAESLSFLQYCPAPVLVVHLQAYAALVPAVLFFVWVAHRPVLVQGSSALVCLLRPAAQGCALLVAGQLFALVYAIVLGRWDLEVILAWSLRLVVYNTLLLMAVVPIVLALASTFRRYVWVVVSTILLVMLQGVLSSVLKGAGTESWLPSGLRIKLLSGSGDTAPTVLVLVVWALSSFALLAVRMWWLRSNRATVPRADSLA